MPTQSAPSEVEARAYTPLCGRSLFGSGKDLPLPLLEAGEAPPSAHPERPLWGRSQGLHVVVRQIAVLGGEDTDVWDPFLPRYRCE